MTYRQWFLGDGINHFNDDFSQFLCHEVAHVVGARDDVVLLLRSQGILQ